MEIGLREWLIIGGAAVVLLIILDGWRRMKGARNRLRMDIEPQPTESSEETGSYNPELPNGGARVIGDVRADALETVSSEARVESEAKVEPSGIAPSSSDQPAIAEAVEASVHVAVETADTTRTEPTFDLPISEERIEPVLDVSSLNTIEEDVVSAASSSGQLDLQPDDTPVSEQSMEPASVFEIDESVVSGSVEEKSDAGNTVQNDAVDTTVQTTVVEEEIMTSAALFEAIEQTRQQRSAAVLEQTLEREPFDQEAEDTFSLPSASDVEADTRASVAVDTEEPEEHSDVSPVRKPDPLLRPLPEAEVELLPEPELTSDPITLTDAPLSDDPLLDGIEEPQVGDDLNAEPDLSEVSDLDLAGVDTDAGNEPRFIQDIQPELEPEWAGTTSQVSQPAVLEETSEPELELPPEFALPADQPTKAIDDLPAQSSLMPVERDETVVAFPEKKVRAKESEVTQKDTAKSREGDNDVKVKAGSLSHQPSPENVLVMTVIANDVGGFNGEVLMKLVLACGMRFGEMDIFHRFEDGIDTGAVQFSMANATGTGTFDVKNITELQTRAVSFFMSMEEPREVMNAFECMLATAETLARHLDGELVDENRIVMRPQTQEHYRQRVRDFEMRNLRRRSG